MARLVDSKQLGKNKDGKIIQAVYYGLSTEEKPTKNLVSGSVFIEVNTQDVFFFEEESETWIKVGE